MVVYNEYIFQIFITVIINQYLLDIIMC